MSMRSIGSIWQATLSGMGSSGAARALARGSPLPILLQRGERERTASRSRRPVSTRIAPVRLHALQGVGKVRRQAPRRDEDDIEPLLVVAVGRIAADPEL